MATHWIDARSRYAEIPGVDPYIDLTFGTTEAQFFPLQQRQEWISVLLRLADPVSVTDFASGTGLSQGLPWEDLVHIPALYRRPVAGLGGQKYCTAYVRREDFLDLLEKSPSLQSAISRIALGQFFDCHPAPETRSEPDSEQPEPAGEPEPGTVVIGIIDDGLAFAHERFRLSADETRVEYLWLQDGDAEGSTVPYGRELRKADIDGLLRHDQPGHVVDEDDLYRRAGAIDFRRRRPQSIARRAAHGTHVMGLACGYDFRHRSRRDRPIVCVQLPATTTEDTSGATLDDYGLDAIRYILDRADAIARRRGSGRLPVVINLSYGNVAGPHDGSSNLEQAIDDLVCARRETAPTEVVLPAGNSNLARLHAQVSLDGQPVDLHWRVLPDDATPSFMEVWLPRTLWQPLDSSRVSLRVMAPGGQLSDPLREEPGAGTQLRSDDEEVLCEARYRYVPGRPGEPGRGVFLVALQPSTPPPAPLATDQPATPVAASGVWTVRLEKSPDSGALVVEAWIQRDDTPFGFRRRGRQSYFDEPCYVPFDAQGHPIEIDDHPDQPPCKVKRAGSGNAIATGATTTVIAGRLRKERRLASYSARADQSEVSDDSLVHGGVLAAGTRSGSIVAMRGTSVAAPQRTRWLADQLAPATLSVDRPRPKRFRDQPAA